MARCSITYKLCGSQQYSDEGLSRLDRNLKILKPFPYTSEQQRFQAMLLGEKLSIQGLQPKLSVKLNVKEGEFKIVEKEGMFIIKPPHQDFQELPENEDLTMKLAEVVGVEVPFHGLIYNLDGSFSYFIKRFDRITDHQKLLVRDFSDLLQTSSIYDSSMEKITSVVDQHCTYPILEKIKLFQRVIFNFLVGNEDMHLKNFSLIYKANHVSLSPAYDLVNTTLILKAKEEIALPLKGKKSNLTRNDLLEYFGINRLGLTDDVINEEMHKFRNSINCWKDLIKKSFISLNSQNAYLNIVDSRWNRLFD